jgi:hypothetical protein
MELSKNDSSIEHLIKVIHSLGDNNQLHIASIIRKNGSIKMNENKSGIMINASIIPPDVLEEIYNYIKFISKQEDELQTLELKKLKCSNIVVI